MSPNEHNCVFGLAIRKCCLSLNSSGTFGKYLYCRLLEVEITHQIMLPKWYTARVKPDMGSESQGSSWPDHFSKGQNGNTPTTQLTGIEDGCSTNGISHEGLVQLHQCCEQFNKQLISYQSIYCPTLSTPPGPSLSSRQNLSLFLAAPTDSRPVICHVRRECITSRTSYRWPP